MQKRAPKQIVDVVRELSRYSPDAFDFLREGLDYTVQRKHGPEVDKLRQILEWLQESDLELSDLPEAIEQGDLPKQIADFIAEQGGPDVIQTRLNLHVGGQDLCWGLRDLALERWGLMAPAVLQQWGIKATEDFGRMVFALVDNGLLQKHPHDQIADFEGVFEFDNAFERSYRINLGGNARDQKRKD